MQQKRIEALDGLRAIAIIFVVWLHIWEQSWLTPYIIFNNKFTRYIGITESHLQHYVRYGALFVELLILLCVACNFIPYARSIIYDEPWPDKFKFWKNRAIRVLPSYYLAVFIPYWFALATHSYEKKGAAIADFITDLTMTNIFFEKVNVHTNINGVLWTVQTEIWIYLFLPLVAYCFKKKPLATLGTLWGVGLIYIQLVKYNFQNHLRVMGIYMPTNYLMLMANGILVIMLYFRYKKELNNIYVNCMGAFISVCSIIGFNRLLAHMDDINQAKDVMLVDFHIEIQICFTLMLVGFLMMGKISRKLFGNKFFVFICSISYNLYLWHQWVALSLKKLRIPSFDGDIPPNQLMDKAWSRTYTVLVLVISLAISILLTKYFEQPISAKLRGEQNKNGLSRKRPKRRRVSYTRDIDEESKEKSGEE